MPSHESITLSPLPINKVGSYHCVVTREGHVAVGGDTHEIGDGESYLFVRSGITVKRNGSLYTFSRN
jgi:hypothetical protein